MDLIEKIFTDKKERRKVRAAFNKYDKVDDLNNFVIMQSKKFKARLMEMIESNLEKKYSKGGGLSPRIKALRKLTDDLFVEVFDIGDSIKDCNTLWAQALKMVFDEEKATDIFKVTTRLDEEATKVLARKKSFEKILSRLLLLSAKVEVDIKNTMN